MQQGSLTEYKIVLRNLTVADLLRKSVSSVVNVCKETHVSETRGYLLGIFFLRKDAFQRLDQSSRSSRIFSRMVQQRG